MKEFRCANCRKLLGKYTRCQKMVIKCPRCGEINKLIEKKKTKSDHPAPLQTGKLGDADHIPADISLTPHSRKEIS